MLRELAAGVTVQHPAADIRFAAPDALVLDAERAIPLALILSELMTQALRHAHPEGRGGPVQLSARLDRGVLMAEVAGAGIGLPDAAGSQRGSGLGETVIHALARQIAAELVTEFEPRRRQAGDAAAGARRRSYGSQPSSRRSWVTIAGGTSPAVKASPGPRSSTKRRAPSRTFLSFRIRPSSASAEKPRGRSLDAGRHAAGLRDGR